MRCFLRNERYDCAASERSHGSGRYPSALVTGTFLAFASRTLKENEIKVDPSRMWFGLLAAIAAVGVTGSLVGLLAPLGFRSVFVFRGGVEATLVVYWMILLSALGTGCYGVLLVFRCTEQLRRPSR